MAEKDGPRKPRSWVQRISGQAPAGPDESTRGLSQLNLAFSFGVASLLALYLGYVFGRWVDRILGTEPFGMFVGVLLGVGASFKMLITDVLGDKGHRPRGDGGPPAGDGAGVGGRPEDKGP